jgi:hypothetical protein
MPNKNFLTHFFCVFLDVFEPLEHDKAKKLCPSVFLYFCLSVMRVSVNMILQQRSNVENSLRCQNAGIWNRKKWFNFQPEWPHFRGVGSLYGAQFQVASRGLVSSAML